MITSNDGPDPADKYILDFVSEKPVTYGPEERDAVQVFARMLVHDYGYPKTHLQTHPQYRVKVRPSDTKKAYPLDIAVFRSIPRSDDTLHIVVECKKTDRTDGRSQLEDYLRFCRASLGVWFNGDDRLFLKKIEEHGKVLFEEIPNIPRFGQRLEDVGQFKRKDLKPATNLKSVFRTIRNFLAANAVGITRDEIFAQQLINIVFCKIYDERFTKKDDMISVRAGVNEPPADVKARIVTLFEKVKDQYSDVVEVADSIALDDVSLTYVVGSLQLYALSECERDAVAEAFEIFIGPSLKGPQGQFFTPRNVVKMVVDMLNPDSNERIIDPACGSGGFLVEALRHVWKRIEDRGRELGWPHVEIEAEKQRVAIKNFRGIDKDSFLSKVAKAYMAILGDGRGGVFCENSLHDPENWQAKTRDEVRLGFFDVVVTNPPFGKKLSITAENILKNFDLGHTWKRDTNGTLIKGSIIDKQPPQILFIERCLQLAKPGGRIGIVLLESTFGMPKYRYVVDYITREAKLLAIVTLPEDLFQPNTHAKTCVVILEKSVAPQPYPIFMCDVKWCGHDSRGNPTYTVDAAGKSVPLDEIPDVAALYMAGRQS